MQSNLNGTFDDEPANTHRDKNQILYEKLETETKAIAQHLRGKEAKMISEKLHQFWSALPASGYPVFDKQFAVNPGSDAWKSAVKASNEWTAYLTTLRQRCAQYRLRCW